MNNILYPYEYYMPLPPRTHHANNIVQAVQIASLLQQQQQQHCYQGIIDSVCHGRCYCPLNIHQSFDFW
jgi:hypothetical protein